MSVKNMLPIIGVGSAAALIGLVASRRSASQGAANPTPRQRPSGISLRGRAGDASLDAPEDLPAAPHGLPNGFWDATPESASEVAPGPASSYAPESYVPERQELNERDGLTAEWLTRATQAPALEAEDDFDDPAEIPADSLSMISHASRYAAAQADDDDIDALSER